MTDTHLTAMNKAIDIVQWLIEDSLPDDVIRGELAKAIKTLRELAVTATEYQGTT